MTQRDKEVREWSGFSTGAVAWDKDIPVANKENHTVVTGKEVSS